MNTLDLRPLSIGEILDRTFTMYRRQFLLFIGLDGLPKVLPLALSMLQVVVAGMPATQRWIVVTLMIATWLANLIGYVFSQGGTVVAVSELYVGRPTTIGESLRKVWDDFGALFGVLILNGLAVGAGLVCLIAPGVYILCRLLICVPCALIEKRGPRDSLSRSWDLTRDHAGRAFLILLLTVVLSYGAQLVVGVAFGVALATIPGGMNSPNGRIAMIVLQFVATLVTVLITPILLISTSIFYYDLRIRKEGFDLELMMDPNASQVPRYNPRSIIPEY